MLSALPFIRPLSKSLALSFTLPPDRPLVRAAALELVGPEHVEGIADHVYGDKGREGILAWFARRSPKANGNRLKVFGYDYCAALAIMINLGFEARAAAALLDLDLAIPISSSGSELEDKAVRIGFQVIGFGDDRCGERYSVILREDAWDLRPEEVQQREGYVVIGLRSGKMTSASLAASALEMISPGPPVRGYQ